MRFRKAEVEYVQEINKFIRISRFIKGFNVTILLYTLKKKAEGVNGSWDCY